MSTRRLLPVALATVVLVTGARSSADAQVYRLRAGSSTLYEAHGASVDFWLPGWEGWIGFGRLDGTRVGGFARTRVADVTLELGDRDIPLRLPADVFGGGHYLLGRGAGISREQPGSRWSAFLGAATRGVSTPFFRGATTESFVGVLLVDRALARDLTLFSRNVLAKQHSSIQGLRWSPRPGLDISLAAGTGGGDFYGAGVLSAATSRVSLDAAWVETGRRFRLLAADLPTATEPQGPNLRINFRPTAFLGLGAGHQSFLPPRADELAASSSVTHYSVDLSPGPVRLSASRFLSAATGGRSSGTSASAGVRLGWFDGGVALYRSRAVDGAPSTTTVATLRQDLSLRLGLLQVVSHAHGGGTSVALGGRFLSNPITLGVEYRTIFVPGATGDPFRQVLSANALVHPFGNVQLSAGTQVTTDGEVRYTLSASTFLYGSGAPRGGSTHRFRIDRHVVRGRVTLEDGRPVSGASLRVGDALVFTDSQGRFMLRRQRGGSHPLVVLVDEFLTPGRFAVVSAPERVTARSEAEAQDVLVVLRRIATAGVDRPR